MFVVQRKCQKCNGILQDSIFLNLFYYHINVFCRRKLSIKRNSDIVTFRLDSNEQNEIKCDFNG